MYVKCYDELGRELYVCLMVFELNQPWILGENTYAASYCRKGNIRIHELERNTMLQNYNFLNLIRSQPPIGVATVTPSGWLWMKYV